MKKSDIYEIAVKILGLYLVIYLISMFQQFVGSLLILFSGQHGFSNNDSIGFLNLLITLVYWALYIGFIYLLLFKTKWIVKKICVESDYAENAQLFADKKTIFEIALLIIGGVMVVSALPDLGYRIYDFFMTFRTMGLNISIKNNETRNTVTSIIKLVIGILIALDARPLAAFLTREKKGGN